MGKNTRTIVNVICSVMVLITNLAVSFVLSPFIVARIGVEANGFVTLASNFVTYAQLIVTALNSMAARYISIAYIKEDYKKANLYYNSVFWGNLIIVAVLIFPATYFIVRMEQIINIPSNIIFDVKLLFSFVFFNFFLTTGFPNWDCGTFITNRLDRTYIPSMTTSVLRCAVLFCMMAFLTPHVWYVGMAASMVTVIGLAVAGYNTHKLTPELKISLTPGRVIFSGAAVKKLVGSGIWNSISNVGNMLLSGLDLIICNVFIGATAMGVVSLSKVLYNLMMQLSVSLRSAFSPELTIDYAKGDKEAVLRNISRAMKLTAFVMTIPIAGIVSLGDRFYLLWVPTQDARLLQTLSILSIFGLMFTSGTQVLFNVFTVVNKVRQNAIAMLISGVVSTVSTICLVYWTDLDIYAVAGVSSCVNLIRNMTFTLPATAKYLGFKWTQFYPYVVKTAISSILIATIGFIVKKIIPCTTWAQFFLTAIIVGGAGLSINSIIVLSKDERIYIIDKVWGKMLKCKRKNKKL